MINKSKFLLFTFLSFTAMITAQNQVLQWKIRHPISGQELNLGTKGSVQEALIQQGDLPDPFYGENESKFNWIEKHDWEFNSDFQLSEAQLAFDFLEIDFPSIDTYAAIYLNDSLIARTANAFHAHRIEIKPIAKLGLNRLKVVFTSPVNYHRKAYEARSSQLPAPNDVGEIAVASMSRKPQYQFGWDWALRMNTMGFWKPVTIHGFNKNRIIQAKIETKSLESNAAKLQLSVYLSKKTNTRLLVRSTLFGQLDLSGAQDGQLSVGVELKNPTLWWPRGHGEQFLYTDTLRIYTKDDDLVDKTVVRFGVRTSALVQDKDQWGTAFYFKINGKPIFCKGANFIPQDVFPARITAESTRYLVEMMRESNFNTVRVWGGGYYQDEAFYESCDELGIMVWQDLMFACAMYPGNDDFLDLVKNELEEQLPRLAAHPSLIYFNGNNEVDVAWKNWGFQLKYLIKPKTQREIERDYDALFKNLAPKMVTKHSFIPYVHTSPLSNWGKDEYYNHGTMHYWGVWHGKDPIEDFGLKTGRFNAEYGFQSFPEMSTLKTFSDEKDWNLESPVMKQHQKSYVGNGMIKKHADLLYGEVKSFPEFVYLSQLTQAKAVGIAISGHRADMPRCMGTLYWQFNDCWPAPTWSGIDYYNNWKALQYQVKKDYEDIAVIEQTKKMGEERYFIVSDLPDSFQQQVVFKAYDLEGKSLFSGSEKINLDGPWLQEVCKTCQEDQWKKENFVLEISWQAADKSERKRVFLHERKAFSKAISENVQLELLDVTDKTALVKITNKQFLANCWVFSKKGGIRFEENFEHYLPGEHFIRITFSEKPVREDFDLMWR